MYELNVDGERRERKEKNTICLPVPPETSTLSNTSVLLLP
jgi:hypothetical protein